MLENFYEKESFLQKLQLVNYCIPFLEFRFAMFKIN